MDIAGIARVSKGQRDRDGKVCSFVIPPRYGIERPHWLSPYSFHILLALHANPFWSSLAGRSGVGSDPYMLKAFRLTI